MSDTEVLLVSEEIDKLLEGFGFPPTCRDFVLGSDCPNCGIVPLFLGHECSENDDAVKMHCPACLKLLAQYKAGQLLFTAREERCKCAPLCPFCFECCKLLAMPVASKIN
jgi:hypothetical protein